MSHAARATLLVFTTSSPRCGSMDTPLQFAPPTSPGKISVPCTLGGVKMPSLRSASMLLRHARRWGDRERLGRPGLLTGDVRGRHRAFFDWEQGRTGLAIEDEQVAHLGRYDHSRDVLPVSMHGDQRGQGWHVIVPEVVVHHLKVPHRLAGRGAQSDDRVRVIVPAIAFAAVEVDAGTLGG